MIIVQTPLRISLLGGGTDFRSYFMEEGGCVLSTAIDKFIFVTVKQRFDDKLRIGYTRTEMVDRVDEIQHELIRESLLKTGINCGLEITTMGDIPSAGSGLGSSSTVTVGSLHALTIYLGQPAHPEYLARTACEIEIDILRKPIGVQDQYIAAYGGLRFIEFTTEGQIRCEKLVLAPEVQRNLDENLLLFFTGVTRESASILTEQQSNIVGRKAVLSEMKRLAYEARDELRRGNTDAIGHLLHEGWELKKQMASRISNGSIDELYRAARSAGALGGKITGAGGGGFLLLYCPEGKREPVRRALHHLRELPFKFESDGSKPIFNYRR